jgi:rod shape-determining protein MreD
MSRTIIINIIRFIVLIFIQVFLLKNITLYNLSIPYLYILFILLLPFEIPNILLFIFSFALGLTIDAFYNTPGLHAAACTLLAFVRILFISITVQKEGFDNDPEPTLSIMGFRWFFTYALVLTLFPSLLPFQPGSFSPVGNTIYLHTFYFKFSIYRIFNAGFGVIIFQEKRT